MTTMITDNDDVGYARISGISEPTANDGFDNRAQSPSCPMHDEYCAHDPLRQRGSHPIASDTDVSIKCIRGKWG
ncbi:unnamed protein product [Lasius platythorax]|uniref:Uncharacterized protein n=1 Tax=Lasius platythorax TaxID=488582 RepID=A0AAV2NC38_9HYME